VDAHVALGVDDAVVEGVDLGDPDGQRLEHEPLGGEELAPAGVELGAEAGVDLVAPDDGLAIEVVPIVEVATGEEVLVDVVEGPLDARRAVGVADLVGGEGKVEPLGEGGHLGHRHHVSAGAREHDDVGVVDHAAAARAPEIGQRVGEEDLAVEAREGRAALDEDHPRGAQHQ
jgi:hypothetical protein